MECPNCASSYGLMATTCPHCGASVVASALIPEKKSAVASRVVQFCILGILNLGVGSYLMYVAGTRPAHGGAARVEPRYIDGAIVKVLNRLGDWPQALTFVSLGILCLLIAWRSHRGLRKAGSQSLP